jgi:hypothetical protein
MLKTVLFCSVALVACKKEKKAEPAMDKPAPGSASAAPMDKPADKMPEPAAASGSAPAAGSDMGSAAAGSGSAAAAAPATFEPKWEKYESKEGKFTIEFPSKAEESDKGGMKMVGAQFGVTAKDDRTAMCGVVYLDFPPDAKIDTKAALEGGMASHKQNAKVLEEKDLKLDKKHPGKSLVVQNDSHRKWVRMFVVNKRLYVLNCGGPSDRGDADGAIATKTLDSFALAK